MKRGESDITDLCISCHDRATKHDICKDVINRPLRFPPCIPSPSNNLILRVWGSCTALLDEVPEEYICLQHEGEENLIKQLVSISPNQIILQTIGL